MRTNIILIGFMGTGKSTTGKIFAEETNRIFMDTDQLIEEATGMPISNIFSQKGEEYFRLLEHKVIAEVSKDNNKVIATGGGVVLNPENMKIILGSSIAIALKADPETLWQRLRSSTDRPLLSGENPKEKLYRLYKSREKLYDEAHFTVNVDNKTPLEIVSELIWLTK